MCVRACVCVCVCVCVRVCVCACVCVCVCCVSDDVLNMLQNTLKKLGVNTIQGIEEVNMIKDDGHVLHFTNPKGNLINHHTYSVRTDRCICNINTFDLLSSFSNIVQASLAANTFAITGNPEEKRELFYEGTFSINK